MRQLLDPITGEDFEVLDDDIIGTEPYDYGQFKRMAFTVSRQHRQAIADSERSGVALASAEVEYHKQLTIAVINLKKEHGATVAETLAKGEPLVREAKEQRDICAARDRAAMETIRLCRDDRASALTLGAWSREAGAEGWQR